MFSNLKQPRSFAISGTSEQTFLAEISARTSPAKPLLQIIASADGSPDQEITIQRLLSSLPEMNGNVSVALPLHFFEVVMVSLPLMPTGSIDKALPYHLAKTMPKPLQDFIYDWLLTRQKKDTLEITVYLFPINSFNILRHELSQKKLKLQRLEPDVFAAFAYLNLTNRLPVARTAICTLAWPHHSSHAIYENDRLQLVRSVPAVRPTTPYSASHNEPSEPQHESESTGPEPASTAEIFTDETFMAGHDSASILNGFSLAPRTDLVAPPPLPEPKLPDRESAGKEAEPRPAQKVSAPTWADYISTLSLEIIRTKDFYGIILKGSNIDHLVVGGGEEFLPELGVFTKGAMDLEPEELLPANGTARPLPAPLDAICLGTGTGRTTRFRRINLVPQLPFSEKIKAIVPDVVLVILALIFVAIFLQSKFLANEIGQITDKTASLATIQEATTKSLTSLNELAGELDTLQKQEIALQEEIGKIEAIRSHKIEYSLIISTIATLLPDSLKCDSISFRGRQGIIEGLASRNGDLPLTISRLKENPVFSSAFLKDVDTTGEQASAPLSFRIMVEIR